MNIQRNEARPPLCPKMALRLWLNMMLLVLMGIAFMWVAQIYLFEQNYVQSAISDVQGRVASLEGALQTGDLAEDEQLLISLGMSVNSKTMLVDASGELIGFYSFGHRLDYEDENGESVLWDTLHDGENYQKVQRGEQMEMIHRQGAQISGFTIGVPVRYGGAAGYAILYHSLSDLYSVLEINRRQLIALSVLLTLSASVLAAVLSRRFTRPIMVIKQAVDRLAEGDLTAKPGLHRDDEIGQLSDSVEQLGRALQRVDVLRKEVIANVSHELRAPLSLIGGYAEMVRDISWKDAGKREEDLTLIIHEARRMSEMVDDIMDYSQLQAGYIQLKKDWYNLCEIVESETAHCEKAAAENHLSLCQQSFQPEVSAYLDALKISRVVRNLLYNAINHTRDGGTITVGIARSGAGVRVSVVNPGEPIPEEDRAIIWERYQRSQHQGGRRQGTGIGLSIVSTILQAHNMSYGVDCRDGLTIFWFDCPNELLEL